MTGVHAPDLHAGDRTVSGKPGVQFGILDLITAEPEGERVVESVNIFAEFAEIESPDTFFGTVEKHGFTAAGTVHDLHVFAGSQRHIAGLVFELAVLFCPAGKIHKGFVVFQFRQFQLFRLCRHFCIMSRRVRATEHCCKHRNGEFIPNAFHRVCTFRGVV